MAEENSPITTKQITVILGLITTVAGAVAGCLMMLYGNQIRDIRADNAADIARLEAQLDRVDDDCEDSARQMQQVCEQRLDDRDERINTIMSQLRDVKDLHVQTNAALELCLSDRE
jgi:hypothetical protein|tara:strand:- start:416 stop:763 length:348 start_codon:yes stop_codon:yes gene_type:complete